MNMKKKVRIGAAVLLTAVLFTLFVQILDYFETPAWKPLSAFILILGLLAVAGCHLPGILPSGCRELLGRGLQIYCRAEEAFYSMFTERSFFLQIWLLLFLIYLPAWLALFPGTFGYDAPIQVAEYFRDAGTQLTSHHPLAHTFLMGFFFSMGDRLFRSYQVGFALYMALQGLAVTGSIAYSLLACRRHHVPLVWILTGALWAAFNPFLWVLTFSSTKDILFGAFLLCFSVALWELLECGSPGRGHYVRLVVFGVLLCLFRNQGIYILLALLFICLLLRTGRKGLCLCLLLVCVVSQGFFSISAGALHIPRGDRREMLCVPMQQMARLCSAWLADGGESGSITPEQYQITAELIAPEGIQMYLPDTADNVKLYFRTDVLSQDFGKYFSNYIAMGRKNPYEYLMAWVDLIRPYWDMTSNEYKGLAFYYTFPERNRWGIERSGDSGPLGKLFSLLYSIVEAPAYGLFWRPETCLWILAALPGLAIARKRKNLFIGILPLGLYFGTAVLGPVALLRYLFPLTMATPLLLGMLFQTGTSAGGSLTGKV